ncbi:hypothetical protein DFO66_103391 [Brevibacterium sanguinis]|uniref:TM2 domain-containing protein n=2 Tax=Brevibacterium TaxID=1696 RepID=A0A366IKY2_9MICO|nr:MULTISPECIES: NINE protein [Brevibacterium]RBP66441.1 hypothetical protein DFO66_103391 [Brevibacterium sanguinis]RBP73093.1 hypothetical protein DFO65_103391 [Brevibacterium celere]
MSNGYGPALPPKDGGIALVLALVGFVAIAGLQYFYIGKIGKGVLFLLTVGFLGVGTLYSCFTIQGETKQINAQRAVGIS